MSRSRKLPIVKDHSSMKKNYHRAVRSAVKNYIRSCKDVDDINNVPNPKTIMDDWDYCDYSFDCRSCSCSSITRSHCSSWKKDVGFDPTREEVCKECREKYSRK